MTEQPPLTEDQYRSLEGLLEQQQALMLQQEQTIEKLKRCYALAYLAGVHPTELKGRVSKKLEYRSGQMTPMYRWRRKASLVITVQPTTDDAANKAALRMGVDNTITVPLEQVPDCLWDPEDLNWRNRLEARAARIAEKENQNGN